MAQSQQFLQDFQNSMDRLGQMNQKIQDSLKQKKDFSDKLVNKLKGINSKIQGLAEQINKLRANLDDLKGQVNSNSGSINNKDKQISELTQNITTLEADKKHLSEQLDNFQKKCNDEKIAIQTKIDNDEAEVRKLTQDNLALKNQADALTKELASKGDTQGQHAEEIKKQTEDFQKQYAAQEEANKKQIDELMAHIQQSDNQILDLQKQLKEKTEEAASHAKTIDNTQNQGKAQIVELNKEIESLKAENDLLINKIKDATIAISKAIDNLEILANSVPNSQTEEYINKLFSEIENSLQNISGAIQGQSTIKNPTIVANNILPDERITLSQIGGPPVQLEYQNIINELNKKNSQPNSGKKYSDALNELRQPNVTIRDVPTILTRNNISYKNNQIMGGKKSKKTKKLKKQKGGYTYKNYKRRSITTKSIK
jgi:predicted  nucleic acid-binding Zn-ribbon protein